VKTEELSRCWAIYANDSGKSDEIVALFFNENEAKRYAFYNGLNVNSAVKQRNAVVN